MVDALSAISGGQAAATSESKATVGLAEDFNSFLNLLTVQLQNQDPTEPLDTNQLTDQIVQFTQAEQQININTKLEELIALNRSTTVANGISYIDKIVQVEADEFNLRNSSSILAYQLPTTANEVTINISDENGKVIKTFNGTGFTSGEKHDIEWDSTDTNGNPVADGVYKVNVLATNSQGSDIDVETFVTDLVTEVDLNGTDAILSFGKVSVPLENIRTVMSINAFANQPAATSPADDEGDIIDSLIDTVSDILS